MSIPSLTTALCLPALEIEALLQGRMIVAMSNTFRNPLQFVLCPVTSSKHRVSAEKRYRPGFLRSLKPQKEGGNPNSTTLYAWAKFGKCQIYNEQHDLDTLSKLTIWSAEYLRDLIRIQHKIFLMSLQVYRFEQPVTLALKPASEDKIGRYIRLPGAPDSPPGQVIISLEASLHRQQQLIDLFPPQHPELEELQADLSQVRESGLGAMSLDRDIRYFLGWSRTDQTRLYDSDFAWIKQIAQTGNSSDGHQFEKLVRHSLIKLGFSNCGDNPKASLDPHASGGAGGLDIYCEAPYALVAECKASKHGSVPNSVTEQLIRLGNTHLPATEFAQAVKLLFVAGPLTDHAEKAAIGNRMNVMRPETLQRLTELQASHPGSIDLYRLKPCLQSEPFGEEADAKVHRFIDETLQQLEIRAELIRAVKNCLQTTGETSVGTDAVYFTYAANLTHTQLPSLSRIEVQETLVELSSPLAGYLGRVEDKTAPTDRRSHRFYFLRELQVEHDALAIK